MSHYASRTRRPPRTLSDDEVKRLLKASGEHRDGFRDHVILSLALGTALRESEIVALDVADVTPDGKRLRWTFQLRVFKRAGAGADPELQQVCLPKSTYYKLEKYLRQHPRRRDPRAPLFPSRQSERLSTRRVRAMFAFWQGRAGFDRLYSFHHLRHTALTILRRRTKDLAIVQRAARHARIDTTMIYAGASHAELAAALWEQPG